MTIAEFLKHSNTARVSIDTVTYVYWDAGEQCWIIKQSGKVVDCYNYEENLVAALLEYEDTGSFGRFTK